MTVEVGYDPRRIRRLTRTTLESIEALATIRSDDPAADDAVLAVRNARRNLEDTWMPLLREIEASEAMLTWDSRSVAGLRAEWSASATWLSYTPYGKLDDEELLTVVGRLDELVPLVDGDAARQAFARWLEERRSLAVELARRVRTDPAFADELAAATYRTPLIGLLVGLAAFPADFRSDALAATLAAPWWEAGWEMDKYAGAADTLIASVLDEPGRCLDVLGRDGVAAALAGWPPIDQQLVADFVVAAMLVAPHTDPDLLPAGYGALREFIRLANERQFDDYGFQRGAATGLATAIGGFVPTLIPGLENEHEPVIVRSHGLDAEFDLTLSTREELVDFLGAIVRTPSARAVLGTVLGRSIRDALGPDPQVDIGSVAEFAELIELSASNEIEESAIAAATRRTTMLRVGGAIGLGVAIGSLLAGWDGTRRAIVGFVGDSLTDAIVGTIRADRSVGRRLGPVAYQSIQIEACRRFVTDPDVRRASGATRVGAAPLRSLESRLREIDSILLDPAIAPDQRQRAVLNLLDAVRDAGGGPYLDTILEENSVDDLNEAGHTTD